MTLGASNAGLFLPTMFPFITTSSLLLSSLQSLGIPRHIWSKVTDHLNLTNYAHQSIEVWKQSDIFTEQYRGTKTLTNFAHVCYPCTIHQVVCGAQIFVFRRLEPDFYTCGCLLMCSLKEGNI